MAEPAIKNDPEFNFDRELAKFQPKQQLCVNTVMNSVPPKKFVLYGGALGGGKSYMLRWLAIRLLIYYYRFYGLKNVTIMLACEDYPSLNDRQLQKILVEFPRWLGTYFQKHKVYGNCFILNGDYGRGVLCFRNLDDPSKYASAEFASILVDELTKNPFQIFDHLRMRCRHPGIPDEDCKFVGGTNPGSIGHAWVKQLWMDKVFPPEYIFPDDIRSMFAYVPSKATDNKFLDAGYWRMLNTLPAHLRPAFRDGDWSVFSGQAFQEWSANWHIIEPERVPDGAPLYMTFDWGFGKPFSIGWWFITPEGRAKRFMEWYGWNGTPDTGLRLQDSAIADGIIYRERQRPAIFRDKWLKPASPDLMEEDGRAVIRLADPTCWNKKPDYKGGGQGPSTAEEFQKKGIIMQPGDPDRKLKIRQFREYLKVQYPDMPTLALTYSYHWQFDEQLGHVFRNHEGRTMTDDQMKVYLAQRGHVLTTEPPMMQSFKTCEQFNRIIPSIPMDESNIEDVDTKSEDHCYDEACLLAMARPLTMEQTPRNQIQEAMKYKSNAEKAVFVELMHMKRTMKDDQETMDALYNTAFDLMKDDDLQDDFFEDGEESWDWE